MPIDTIKLPNQLKLPLKAHFYILEDKVPSAKRLDQILDRIEKKQAAATVHREAIHEYQSLRAQACFIILEHRPEPSFLDGTDLIETRYAIVVLVAVPGVLAALTAGGFSWSDSLIGEGGQPASAQQVGALIGDTGTRFERLNSRSMSTSRNDIRARTLEAVDLGASLSPLGLNRQIIQSLRVSSRGRTYNTNPGTGLVSESGDRRSLKDYATWVARIAKELSTGRDAAAFLGYFAQPVDIADLPDGVTANGVLVDLQWLMEGLDRGEFGVYLVRGKRRVRVPDEMVRKQARVFTEVGVATQPGGTGSTMQVQFPGLNPRLKVELKQNKASFSLTEKLLSKIHIVARDGSRDETIGQRLKDESALLVTTTDVRFAFAFGRLFKDGRVQSLASSIRGILKPVKGLKGCQSEKEEKRVTAGTKEFAVGSVFRVVEDEIATDDVMLVCDDLGDEWADYIGIRPADHRVTLYHAKHGDKTTSASAFHEVVGQAIKNLGRLEVVEEDLEKKARVWKGKWKAKACGIARMRRGKGASSFIKAYLEASASPSEIKRVAIVTSFASKKDIQAILADAAAGNATKAHETQLIWLLVSFVSACRDRGAEPVVFCQP